MNAILKEILDNSAVKMESEQSDSNHKKVILVFDTETSGLFPKPNKDISMKSKLEDYPYILQLSFVLFDMKTRKIIHKYNKYIKVPDHVIISPFITDLTGITREKCNKGVSIIVALQELYHAYKLCDAIVAHNISFDRQMVEIETIRNFNLLVRTIPMIAFIFNSTFHKLENKEVLCTMSIGKNVCNILVVSKTNPENTYKKNPKLEELYEHLFQESINNAHDALYDTLACLRCFLKLYYKIDFDIKNIDMIL